MMTAEQVLIELARPRYGAISDNSGIDDSSNSDVDLNYQTNFMAHMMRSGPSAAYSGATASPRSKAVRRHRAVTARKAARFRRRGREL